MRGRATRVLFAVVMGAALAAAAPRAEACQIPVFRFALERWRADPYEVLIVHRGPLDAKGRGLVARLERGSLGGGGTLNLVVNPVDVTKGSAGRLGTFFARHGVPRRLPAMVLLYPPRVESDRVAWEGRLDGASVEALLDSPGRRAVADRLLAGDSAVWLVLATGDRGKDAAVQVRLDARLRELEKSLRLPTEADIKNDEFYRPDTKVVLRLAFTTVVVRRDDPAERVFAAVLLNSENHLRASAAHPLVLPIYGRGRALFPFPANTLDDEDINQSCDLLTAPCSCQVKQQNPGFDLPFAVDWDARVSGSAAPDRPAPELASFGQLDERGDRRTAAAVVRPGAPPPPPASGGRSPLAWALGGLAVAGLLVVGVGRAVLGARDRRRDG